MLATVKSSSAVARRFQKSVQNYRHSCRGFNTDNTSNTTQKPRPPMPPPRPGARPSGTPVMMGPDGKPLQVISVEKTGQDAWAGVAAIDRGEDKGKDFMGVAKLVGADIAALLVFAAVGRISHHEPVDFEIVGTALPFIIGWFATAPFLGAFGPSAQTAKVNEAAFTAAKCWAVGMPIGLVLRSIGKGYMAPTPFIIVSMVTTGVLLIGARAGIAYMTKEEAPLSPAAQLAKRQNKSGNPLEFFELLFSLVKRW